MVPAHNGDAYRALRERVATGKLIITGILGPPRSGTTALEKFMMEKLDAGEANLNHPILFNATREGAFWDSVLAAVERIEAHTPNRDLAREPIRILIKETTDTLSPDGKEAEEWIKLCRDVFVCVRNPLLQLESYLQLYMRYLDENLPIKGGGIPDSYAAGEKTFRGRPVLINGMGFAEMAKKRDYASLTPDFGRLLGVIDDASTAQLKEIFTHLNPQAYRAYVAAAGRDARPDDCGAKIPDALLDGLVEWRLGWRPLERHLPALSRARNVHFVDFTSLQLTPGGFADMLKKDFAHENGLPVAVFDFGDDGKDIAFDNARKSKDIGDAEKTPIPLDRFPQWLHPIVKSGLATYGRVLHHPALIKDFNKGRMTQIRQRLRTRPTPIEDVDPIYSYCLLRNPAEEHPAGFLSARLATVRARHPEYAAYFDMIDASPSLSRERTASR